MPLVKKCRHCVQVMSLYERARTDHLLLLPIFSAFFSLCPTPLLLRASLQTHTPTLHEEGTQPVVRFKHSQRHLQWQSALTDPSLLVPAAFFPSSLADLVVGSYSNSSCGRESASRQVQTIPDASAVAIGLNPTLLFPFQQRQYKILPASQEEHPPPSGTPLTWLDLPLRGP
jgi:hypothetical protein